MPSSRASACCSARCAGGPVLRSSSSSAAAGVAARLPPNSLEPRPDRTATRCALGPYRQAAALRQRDSSCFACRRRAHLAGGGHRVQLSFRSPLLPLDHFAELGLEAANEFQGQIVFGLLAALGELAAACSKSCSAFCTSLARAGLLAVVWLAGFRSAARLSSRLAALCVLLLASAACNVRAAGPVSRCRAALPAAALSSCCELSCVDRGGRVAARRSQFAGAARPSCSRRAASAIRPRAAYRPTAPAAARLGCGARPRPFAGRRRFAFRAERLADAILAQVASRLLHVGADREPARQVDGISQRAGCFAFLIGQSCASSSMPCSIFSNRPAIAVWPAAALLRFARWARVNSLTCERQSFETDLRRGPIARGQFDPAAIRQAAARNAESRPCRIAR